jgi:hypothetical protein
MIHEQDPQKQGNLNGEICELIDQKLGIGS